MIQHDFEFESGRNIGRNAKISIRIVHWKFLITFSIHLIGFLIDNHEKLFLYDVLWISFSNFSWKLPSKPSKMAVFGYRDLGISKIKNPPKISMSNAETMMSIAYHVFQHFSFKKYAQMCTSKLIKFSQIQKLWKILLRREMQQSTMSRSWTMKFIDWTIFRDLKSIPLR